jgi:hypothetical protein
MSDFTREQLVDAARKAQQEVDAPLTRRKFIEITGISEGQINRLFPNGRWTEIRELAGISRHPMDRREYKDDEVLAEYHRVVKRVGCIPTWALFAAEANVSRETLTRRFGGLQGILRAYASWLKQRDPDSPFLELVQSQSRHEIPSPPSLTGSTESIGKTKWQKASGAVFGPPIDFRGLRHAPINEQGVVYLFGVVSYELGFIVEAVHAQYPDCEAKRLVGKDRWQRVRIEFEYKSGNFRDHGHDPAGADLIVCWEHNWPECPLEVLELRKAIDELDG